MEEKYLKIVLEALAEKIDRLNDEVFIRNIEIKNLKEDNAKFQNTVNVLKKALAQEVAKDG